ncbi:uncharacterized protein LOC115210498 [Octopus sinensis]|uniref:Uncharacterized protein LOC115210498 n=1 Tax=Octopus sinensis TaxID=2607531 RepID=A0A6P7S9M6_9MOLL|nr:uncharacterized protein LOC115210498 [Octopus sinensis]
MLEGTNFAIYTDHKPLVYAFNTKPDRHSPREIRHLDFISQYTTDIRHIKGTTNLAADALSRAQINAIHTTSTIDLARIAADQENDEELLKLRNSSSLKFQHVPLPSSTAHIWCDISTGYQRPYVPQKYRREVFSALHSLSHPGICSTQKLISTRFVWTSINKDIREWTKCCVACQKAKIHRHIKSPIGSFSQPDARFQHVHIDIVGPPPPSQNYSYLLTCTRQLQRTPQILHNPDTPNQEEQFDGQQGLCKFFGPAFLMTFSAYMLKAARNRMQPCQVPFPISNQSVSPYGVRTVASWFR